MNEFSFSGKLYLQVGDTRAIGPGRVELLERIQITGSIRQADQVSYGFEFRLNNASGLL